MVATCTAPLRLEKTTKKNMHSRGNTATYHYANDAALPLFCVCFLRGIAANVFAAAAFVLPQMCSRHCRFFAAYVVFRGIFAALPLLFWMFFFAFFGANFSWQLCHLSLK